MIYLSQIKEVCFLRGWDNRGMGDYTILTGLEEFTLNITPPECYNLTNRICYQEWTRELALRLHSNLLKDKVLIPAKQGL